MARHAGAATGHVAAAVRLFRFVDMGEYPELAEPPRAHVYEIARSMYGPATKRVGRDH
jgi:hypothetical protein